MPSITVHNRTTTETIGERIQCATSTWTRLVGLLGHSSLEAGQGLWISPSSGVHTFGMRFTIDVVGLDGDRRVVRLWPCLQPYRMTTVSNKVHSVLELAQGQIAKQSICIGDQMHFERNDVSIGAPDEAGTKHRVLGGD